MDKKAPITIDQLVLFVLNNGKPHMGIKKLNKLAFLLEFTYLFEKETELTNAPYAAIDMGPVINDYKDLIASLVKDGAIIKNPKADERLEDYMPQKNDEIVDSELIAFLKTVLRRYEELNPKQLEDLTHNLDSYNITVHENKGKMGGIIDKELAMLDYNLALTDL
jgi:uncharacterized phage-associated protein